MSKKIEVRLPDSVRIVIVSQMQNLIGERKMTVCMATSKRFHEEASELVERLKVAGEKVYRPISISIPLK
jgi:hypothetical protein